MAALLAEVLPESRARLSRAPHRARIASLIVSGQLDLALLTPADAAALRAGRPPFTDYGPVALQRIAGLGDHLLVCRRDFPDLHAYLLAGALAEHGASLAVPMALQADAAGDLPLHRGAALFLAGAPPPAPEPTPHHDHHEGDSTPK